MYRHQKELSGPNWQQIRTQRFLNNTLEPSKFVQKLFYYDLATNNRLHDHGKNITILDICKKNGELCSNNNDTI
jgi:hypothetical protein